MPGQSGPFPSAAGFVPATGEKGRSRGSRSWFISFPLNRSGYFVKLEGINR